MKLFFFLAIFSFLSEKEFTSESQNIDCQRIKAVKTKNEKGNNSTYLTYDYNADGTVKKRYLYYEFTDQLKWAYEFVYDKDGNVTRRTRFDENGKYDGYYVLSYEKDALTKEAFYDINDQLVFEMKYENRNDGKPIKHQYYNAEGIMTEYWTYEYNDKAQNTIKKIFTPDGRLNSTFKMSYDKMGNEWRYV